MRDVLALPRILIEIPLVLNGILNDVEILSSRLRSELILFLELNETTYSNIN
jgi:hypothetical protein